MAAPIVSDIRARLVTLCGQITGITNAYADYPEDNQPFAPAELPVMVVRVGPATNTRLDGGGFRMLRTYQLLLHAARIIEDNAHPSTDEMQAVEPFLVDVPLFFLSRPLLENNDSGLALSTVLPGDGGLQRIVREGAVYWGAVFTLQVQTIHRST